MGRQMPLQQFANVTLDSNGNGQAQLGPSRVREHWQPAACYVEANTPGQALPTLDARAELYIGASPTSLNPSNQYSQTGTGSTGDTCAFGGLDLQTGQYIIVQWVGGDPGAVAVMTVIGTYSIGAPDD